MTLLPMENTESVLYALKCFEQEKPSTIPPILENYIKSISRNGQTMLPWVYVKPLLLQKFNKVVDSFMSECSHTDYMSLNSNQLNEIRQRVYDTFTRLDGIPFTIQRICELFENPTRYYKRVDKYLRGLEKVCMVVSTVDPLGNKIHSEDPRFPSRAGLDDCSLILNGSLTSPPSSPTVDNLQTHQTSKSSDEEITEDDDDLEDNNSDTSDERQSSSPHNGLCLSSSPLGDSPQSPGPWLFKLQTTLNSTIASPSMHFRSPTTSKTHLNSSSKNSFMAGLCASLLPSDKDYVTPPQTLDSEIADTCMPTRGSSDPKVLSNISSDSRSETNFSPSGSGIQCSNNVPDELSPSHEKPKQPLIPSDEDSDDSSSNDSSTSDNGLCLTDESSIKRSVPCTSINVSMPMVCESTLVNKSLRPIGQLEAFVQNLAPNVVSPPTVYTSPSMLSGMSKSGSLVKPSNSPYFPSCLSPISTDDGTQSQIMECSTSPTVPALAGIRRPHSPEITLRSDVISDGSLENRHQSPAKRRRLLTPGLEAMSECGETSVSKDDSSVGNELASTSTISLNNSPPIIMCNPSTLNQVRDHDSGERLAIDCESSVEQLVPAFISPPNSETVLAEVTPPQYSVGIGIFVSESEAEHIETVQASSPITINVNSETGEEET